MHIAPPAAERKRRFHKGKFASSEKGSGFCRLEMEIRYCRLLFFTRRGEISKGKELIDLQKGMDWKKKVGVHAEKPCAGKEN